VVIVTEKTIKRVPAAGVAKLSELEIDVDKDWLGHRVKNLGAPVDAGDAARKGDLDSHRTASPIDHPDGSVTTAKIADGAVTFAKCASEIVSHASRHYANGADPITGWISPSDIGPKSDAPTYMYFRTRNIANTAAVNHYFVPSNDNYGQLGSPYNRWDAIYNYLIYPYSILARATGEAVFPVDLNSHYTLRPATDGYSYVGTATYRFNLVRAVTVTTGDLGFEERRCLVCGREFREGDAVVLKVRRVDGDNMQMLLVPVHAECNPHPLNPELLAEHEKMLLPNRGRGESPPPLNPPKPGEFEVVNVTVEDENVMTVSVLCGDGTALSFPAPVDADEETITRLAREYYKLEKEREKERELRASRGRAKLRREWRGFKATLQA
jgi:hypothetical protein